MEFIILNREQVELYEYKESHINISIYTPGTSKANLSSLATGRKASLFVPFHDCDDIELENACINGFIGTEVSHIKNIKPEQARMILEFYNIWKGLVNLCVVNCEAGISRSSAVAAALTVIDGQSDEWIFTSKKYHPNMLVYRTILNEVYKNA